MFWDMRVQGLEAQALEPLKALEEMRGETYPESAAIATVVSRLQEVDEYRALFAGAFGGAAPVNAENLARALAAFQRTLVSANSPFDRYMRGDRKALNGSQRHGMEQFESFGCINCHHGPMLTDFRPHVIGVPENDKLALFDRGMEDRYAFRTPSLRNLSATAPYMHNGVFTSLIQVIAFYERASGGGRRSAGVVAGLNPQVPLDTLDDLVTRLEIRGGPFDLMAFLRSMDDPRFDRTIPKRVPSGLPVGGRLNR
jgi:cytochrome c peroxidase